MRYTSPSRRALLTIDDEPDWKRRWFAGIVVALLIGPLWIPFLIRLAAHKVMLIMDWIVEDRDWAFRFYCFLEKVEDWALRVGKAKDDIPEDSGEP